jgi:hypothetical protein
MEFEERQIPKSTYNHISPMEGAYYQNLENDQKWCDIDSTTFH